MYLRHHMEANREHVIRFVRTNAMLVISWTKLEAAAAQKEGRAARNVWKDGKLLDAGAALPYQVRTPLRGAAHLHGARQSSRATTVH